MWLPDSVVGHLGEVASEPDLSATKYRVLRRVGSGGMGVVYAAQDTELEREVAVKVSFGGESDAHFARLMTEARVLGALEHPGIVPVYDAGRLPDGRGYYVMKLVRGERLDEWLRKERDRRAALRLFQRICEAVAFAHARGVVHRDLKPSNVMVGAFGEALVMDWGVAKGPRARADPPGGEDEARASPGATLEGTVIGTPGFMAPEQARGEVATVDGRADVYSLGRILEFVLTAQAEDVPRPLSSICARATADIASRRYATAELLGADVGAFLDGMPVSAHRETLMERGARFAARHRVLLSLLAAYVTMRVALALVSR